MKKVLKIVMIMVIMLAGFIVTVKANDTTREEIRAEETVATAPEEAGAEEKDNGKGMSMIGAGLATGLACVGAGIAVALVASSAVGAISEDPSLLGKTIILVGLAEGIAIYGLIISIMILNQ